MYFVVDGCKGYFDHDDASIGVILCFVGRLRPVAPNTDAITKIAVDTASNGTMAAKRPMMHKAMSMLFIL
jgi:hypothetical protein